VLGVLDEFLFSREPIVFFWQLPKNYRHPAESLTGSRGAGEVFSGEVDIMFNNTYD
jgi:hypothetical protein